MELIIQKPIVITEAEAQLILLFRNHEIFKMQFGQCVLHFADGQLKKVEKNESIFKKFDK